ncbi:hypothetical protein, membrane [gut metagenome]|uniref:Glycine zipper domain-containing protein n=1 Tax=gut metagenome TaxID=749906 RepID=J9F741_9ZZZZ
MKRISIEILSLALLCSSCRTQMAPQGLNGLATGAAIGNTIGSAMGGLIGDSQGGWHGGYRGSALGSILGTVTGATLGYAITKPRDEKMYPQENSRYIDTPKIPEHTQPIEAPPAYSPLEDLRIENIRWIDRDRDQALHAEESCKISFEIINQGRETAYHILPKVTVVNGQKRIYISPSLQIKEITPQNGIRYTATIRAGKRIKKGEAVFRLSVTNEEGAEFDWVEVALPTER